MKTPRHKINERLLIKTWTEEDKLERKINKMKSIILIISFILVSGLVMFFLCSTAKAEGLGKNEQEFQIIKAKVQEGIKGTDATLKEVKPAKFTQSDIENIKKAIEQLKGE